MDFFAGVLGWTVIAEPGGSFSGFVGDRLAVRVVAGDAGWRVFFGGDEARELRCGSSVDSGRVLHGPWAPPPRHGEPCWVELVSSSPEDGYWATELGWESRPGGEGVVLFTSSRHGGPRSVAGRVAGSGAQGWRLYFAVDDVVAACARVSESGGRVLSGPATVPVGVVASVEGSHGGSCVLLEKPAGWGGNRAG